MLSRLVGHVPELNNGENMVIHEGSKEDVDAKLQALKIYDEEMRAHPHSRSYENIKNMMKVAGSEVGVKYAEKFQSIRRIIK